MSTTSTQHDGGPAFPQHGPARSGYWEGMSLRQFYKAHALPGILRDHKYAEAGNEAACVYEVSRYAGMMADAMLAEDAAFAQRAKGPTP